VKREKLSAEEIKEKLNELDGWTAEDNSLKKRFSFANFAESLNFVNKAGEIAEKLDHHPDITFGWGYAEFAMTTHDRGGITDFDFALAKEIDGIPKN
jgi:4a-hydroxytetrahydrobiopterin dehydratase